MGSREGVNRTNGRGGNGSGMQLCGERETGKALNLLADRPSIAHCQLLSVRPMNPVCFLTLPGREVPVAL